MWSETLTISGDGCTHQLGAYGLGKRLEELTWHERAIREDVH